MGGFFVLKSFGFRPSSGIIHPARLILTGDVIFHLKQDGSVALTLTSVSERRIPP